jgi:hypothetical protein
VTPAEVLVRAKHSLGLERMVTLATGDDQLNRAYAAEAIGEEVYADPAKRLRAVEVRAYRMKWGWRRVVCGSGVWHWQLLCCFSPRRRRCPFNRAPVSRAAHIFLAQVGGVEALLAMCARPDEPLDALLPALSSLRNILQDNPRAQEQFAFREGIIVMTEVLQRCISGRHGEQTEKVTRLVAQRRSPNALPHPYHIPSPSRVCVIYCP